MRQRENASRFQKPSVWIRISNKNVELMHKFMTELGLSPVSRSRVSVNRQLGPKPWEFTGFEWKHPLTIRQRGR